MSNVLRLGLFLTLFATLNAHPALKPHCQGDTTGGDCIGDERISMERKIPTKKELCSFCLLIMPIVRNLVHKNKTAHLTDIVTYLCNKRLKLADEMVCQMAIEEYQVFSAYNNS
jgi:hypothetical protein